MPEKEKPVSLSRSLAVKVVYAAFQILKEKDGEAPGREVMDEIENRVAFTDWEKSVYEKTGNIRWQSILHFFTIDSVKAGFLIKKKGVWYLTPEGEEALKLGPLGLFEAASKAYKEWDKARKASYDDTAQQLAEEDGGNQAAEATIDEIEQKAMEGLKAYVLKKNAYEFQDLVGALLRGMKYYTPFIAPQGKDGGIDIIAYKDPLGTESPRMKVQIKHRADATTVKEIRELMGLLQKDGDIGIFVSSGGFTSDAKATARTAPVHLELVDLIRFVGLWQEFYPRMVDEDKNLLPLMPIYFLAPNE